MSETGENRKNVKEHVSAFLPFQVLEKIVDKPVRIRGVAMAAGLSRNHNLYTEEELEAFAPKLVGSPVYMEHVSAEKAVGKVTNTEWKAPLLFYEAEIYDDQVAAQIRNGLIQHVSVGADYSALDVVDAKVPHGLSNAELSLVAVPGIPETNVQVLEHLVDQRITEALQKAGIQDAKEVKTEETAKKLQEKVEDLQNKLSESEGRLAAATGKLSDTEKALEDLRKHLPGGGLLAEVPVLMVVSEHVSVLEGLLPAPMVERSSLGMQRECQAIRHAIYQAKEKLKA